MGISLRDMTASDTLDCAALACASEIGERYGFVQETLAKNFAAALAADSGEGRASGGALFVAEAEGHLVGFAWIDPRGAFSSAPYLRLIAVAPKLRGSGVGAILLDEFERRTMGVGRDFCLLVSDFNAKAITFYESHGYAKRGELPDFARKGIAEVLMVKPRPGRA